MNLKTWDEIDLMVESDPLELRNYAWEVTRELLRVTDGVAKEGDVRFDNGKLERWNGKAWTGII